MAKLRTHYDNLQVTRTASPEVIKAAYKGLVQKWHPDRNSPERREECTRVVTVLNHAYAVLSDPEKRAAHDQWIAEHERASSELRTQRPAENATESSSGLSEKDFRSVTVGLPDLPGAVRQELLDAANKARPGYVSAATDTLWRAIAVVLLAGGALAVIGFFASNDRWSSDGHWWALGFAFAFLYWGVGGALLMNTLLREKLAHRVLLTPTHIVESDATTARIWPLLGVKRFAMTVHMRNGSHTGSTIDFQHACGDTTTFSLRNKIEADVLYYSVNGVLSRIESGLAEYLGALQQNPLFRLTTNGSIPRRGSSWATTGRTAAMAAILAVVMHWGILLPINANVPTYRGPPPDRATQPATALSTAGLTPVQPKTTNADDFLTAEPMPRTGWIRRPSGEEIAPLKIRAQAGENYFMKLVTPEDGTVATMFLRAGETLDVDVPIGTYRIRYAYGSRWYGEAALFGAETLYTELDQSMRFYIADSQVAGVEITLTKQVQGNLRDHRVRPDQF